VSEDKLWEAATEAMREANKINRKLHAEKADIERKLAVAVECLEYYADNPPKGETVAVLKHPERARAGLAQLKAGKVGGGA